MPHDRNLLIEEIRSLLARESGEIGLQRLEETLTAGYAHAMALDAELWRLERRLARIARSLGPERPADTKEAAQVSEQLAGVERELSHLRTLLASLRDRARELRTAPAA